MKKIIKETNRRDISTRHVLQSQRKNITPPNLKDKIGRKPVTIKQELVRKPVKINRKRTETNPNLLINTPNIVVKSSIEYPTPQWFKIQGKPDVSVIIPLFKSAKVLPDLINSWDFYNDGLKVEIIFVDDHCPQNSKDVVLKLCEGKKTGIGKIIYNTSNKGYGGSCNAGSEFATGDYLIFLNADTKVTIGWIKPIIDLFKSDSQIGIVGNLQLKESGTWHGTIDGAGSQWTWEGSNFAHIGRHIYNHQFLQSPFNLNNVPPDVLVTSEREMVTGCCLAIPAELNRNIGGFNPNYRIGYWEDAEICLTVREKGYKVMFEPKSTIWHKLSHSNSGNHPFHEFNRSYFHNKWVKSGRIDSLVSQQREHKPDIKHILVQRKESNGDVLVASYVLSALKNKYPGCKISFHTKCKNILKDHPFIDRFTGEGGVSERQYQLIYNLDMVYEYRPYANILEAYADAVGVKVSDCDFFIQQEFMDFPYKDYIVIHAGKTAWVGRDWEKTKFDQLAVKLMEKGIKVVCIGSNSDYSIPCDIDIRGKTTIQQLAYIIGKSKLFVGIDSMPMHVAQAVNTPGVVFFGSIDPKLRIYRDNMKAVTAKNLDCLGCHHRKSVPCVVTNICEKGTLDCINLVSVEDILSQIS